VASLTDGAVVAGSSAGAMVMSDPMIDPRGGAFTIGLGLIPKVAVVPHAEQWSHDRLRRTLDLARGFDLVTVDTGSALLRESDGSWSSHGQVSVYVDGVLADLSALPTT
ncbi:MAG TPA: Type 1 glutamine amidotransferase-like domain-containing protein, partial [Acidimicrobiales bacterium]